MSAAALFIALLAAPPAEEALAAADKLAALARETEEGDAKNAALDRALSAYAAIIAERPKDRRLVPRLRRRRASLLAHAHRYREALAEHEEILAGRARRKDFARALYDSAKLIDRAGDAHAAEKRLRRAADEYKDVDNVRAKANLLRGRILEKMSRFQAAERAYREVIEHSFDEAKQAVAAYDALALLALKRGQAKRARRWLRTCVDRYQKRAARGDRYGAFVARLLGEMKAPRALAEAAAPAGGG